MKKYLLVFLLITLFVFASCSVKETNNSQIIDNQLNNKTKIETQIMGKYGVNLIGVSDTIHYDEGKIILPLMFKNAEPEIEVGIMVFVNGIPQNVSAEHNAFFTIPLSSNETKAVSVDFTPSTGASRDCFLLNIITLFNPSYLPNQDLDLTFGNYHSLLQLQPIKVFFNNDTRNETYSAETKSCTYKPSEKEKASLLISEDSPNQLCLYQDIQNDDPYLLFSPKTSLNLSLAAFGNVSASYRVTIFVNHQLVKLSGAYDYIDIDIQNGKLTTASFSLDANKVNNQDFIYAIAIPLTNTDNAAVLKSKSTFILTETP